MAKNPKKGNDENENPRTSLERGTKMKTVKTLMIPVLFAAYLFLVVWEEKVFADSNQSKPQAKRAKKTALLAKAKKLIATVKKGDWWERKWAAEDLGRIGPVHKNVIPVLIKVAREDPNPGVRVAAVEALGKIAPVTGPMAKDCVRAIIEAFRNVVKAKVDIWIGDTQRRIVTANEEQMVFAATKAFGNIGPEAKDAVPILIDLLKGKYRIGHGLSLPPIRGWTGRNIEAAAAEALGKIGPVDKRVIPALIKQLKGVYIWDVQPPTVFDTGVLKGVVKRFGFSGGPPTARAVVGVLARIGKPAIPALAEALEGTDWNLACNATRVLGKIGKPAIPTLVKSLEKKKMYAAYTCVVTLQGRIALALGMMGPEARETAPVLIRALKKDSHVALYAAIALNNIKPKPETAVPLLIKILKEKQQDKYWLNRKYVIEVLANMGASAKDALPYLKEIAKERSIEDFMYGKREARKAIEKIQKAIEEQERQRLQKKPIS